MLGASQQPWCWQRAKPCPRLVTELSYLQRVVGTGSFRPGDGREASSTREEHLLWSCCVTNSSAGPSLPASVFRQQLLSPAEPPAGRQTPTIAPGSGVASTAA